MLKNRSSIDKKDKWSIELIFEDIGSWQKAFEDIKRSKSLLHYKGKLKDSNILLECIKKYFEISRVIEKLYVYAHLLYDVDLSNEEAKNIYGKISSLYHEFEAENSFLEPEILHIDTKILNGILKDDKFKDYRFYLEKLIRLKKHTLGFEEELILKRAGKCLQSVSLAFNLLNNVDFKFENAKDSKGKEHVLTHSTYLLYLRSDDRVLRKETFEKVHKKFDEFSNTISELLYGVVKNASFESKSRNYKSSLEASLYPKNIDLDVYDNLLDTVRKNIKALHKFVSFKKRALKLDKVHLYDLYAPIVKEIDFKATKDEAIQMVIDSVKPLGRDYQNILQKALTDERWVDFYPTNNKRSGAYSSGCYDSYPYMLINYEGSLNDVLTLAHEAGHSMHSYLSNKNQPYQYAGYPIFLAEIASTFNEKLLIEYLLEKKNKKEEKLFLYIQQLDSINATLFRQTLFADFEKKIHEFEEKDIPITSNLLKKTYLELYKFYYGEDFYLDDLLKVEWARIPHFYSDFYVYQYAVGISTSLYFYDQVKKNNNVDNYLNFLKSGGSDYPVNTLLKANCDVKSPKVVEKAIGYFEEILNKVENLL